MLFVTLEPNESADDDLPRNVAIITLYGAYRFMDIPDMNYDESYAGRVNPNYRYHELVVP